MVYGLEFRVEALGFRVRDIGCRVQGSGVKVQNMELSVEDLGCKMTPAPASAASTVCPLPGLGFRV